MAPNVDYRKVGSVTETHNKTEEGIKTKKAFITEKELREHNGNNGSKSWIAIKDKVYDVTDFGEEHPRGRIIFPHAGQEATDVFNAFHPAAAYKWLPWFYVGELRSLNSRKGNTISKRHYRYEVRADEGASI